jgi:hypothetical protein
MKSSSMKSAFATRVGNGAHVGVQRLGGGLAGLGAARVQAAELAALAEHVADELEHPRLERALHQLAALVGEVREALGPLFLAELGPRALALRREQHLEPPGDALAPDRVAHAFEPGEPPLVELAAENAGVAHPSMVAADRLGRLAARGAAGQRVLGQEFRAMESGWTAATTSRS